MYDISGCLMSAVGNKLYDYVINKIDSLIDCKIKSRYKLKKEDDGI